MSTINQMLPAKQANEYSHWATTKRPTNENEWGNLSERIWRTRTRENMEIGSASQPPFLASCSRGGIAIFVINQNLWINRMWKRNKKRLIRWQLSSIWSSQTRAIPTRRHFLLGLPVEVRGSQVPVASKSRVSLKVVRFTLSSGHHFSRNRYVS